LQSVQFWSVLIAARLAHRRWLALAGLAEVKSLGAPRDSVRIILLGVLFLDTSTIPLVIVAVVVSFVLSKWLTGPPDAAASLQGR
jgi:hypothetical protein